ncbi:hypothetical protein [Actinophytocola sp.]|uniref:hypothetical protein n=1 Tax=Actinophytocola sp. TaxID=1872138 RepID=UPI002ED55C3A
MDIEKLITETFTEHEHVAPDPEPVLAAARKRIDRRRPVLSRPLAVAAGVAVLTLAAVTVVALNRPASEDRTQAAAPPEKVQVSATTEPAPGDLLMPFSLDWLPAGEVDYLARRINVGGADREDDTPLYGGEYMLTVTANGQVIDVDVQQFKMVEVDEAAFKSGPGSALTINGQPAVESSVSDGPGGYELYVKHPDGGTMYVGVSADPQSGSTVPAQQLIDNGRKIAENIRFPGTTTVTPAFGLGELPAGMRMCAFDVEKGFETAPVAGGSTSANTSYSLGTCDTMPSIHVNVADPNHPTGTTGEPVQGHETRYVDENGYVRLWVLNAVDGAPVAVAGKVPLADLYDIANRLVLPN